MTDSTMQQTAEAGARATREEIGSQVLTVVRDLLMELQPQAARGIAVRSTSNLERDLGFDSVSRAELMLRLERTFGIQLGEQAQAEAETPDDLVRAILIGKPARKTAYARRVERPIDSGGLTEPVDASTLVEAVAIHATVHPEQVHIILWSRAGEEQRISYGDLDRAARAVAGGLVQRGVNPGDRVALMLPTEAGFFHSFLGILYAGAIPVPVYPPFRRAQVEDHMRRQAGILRNAEASLLVTNEEISRLGTLLYGLTESLRRIDTVADLMSAKPLDVILPARAGDTALIQYTSGSTGDPKGVVLSHANLLANIRAMGAVLEPNASDVFVSWLPLYHDLGLIGAWMGTLYYGVPAVIMAPFTFLADPVQWLRAIHQHRGTLTAAPNFAYELCLRSVRDEDLDELDLSSLRVMANGAEPVSPNTVRRFQERFARAKFRPKALAPVYGLAECSVGLAFSPPGRGPLIDRIEREAFSKRGVAVPAKPDDPHALEFVAAGQALPGHQIRIVDERSVELPERREGRLQFKGPSTTSGYYRNEEKTRALFDGDWLESGDRGYVAGGDIFITGRIKDIIIRAGRNIYPHELEEFVGTIEGVRKGCVAAFASADPRTGSERLVVVAETRLSGEAELGRLRSKIVEASASLLGIPPDEVVLVPPRVVPKTSSGKVRRSQTRTLFEQGMLSGRSHALWWQLTRLAFAGLGQGLRRVGRLIGEFAYAAWWWLLLLLLAIPVWPLVLLLPKRNWRQGLIGAATRLFFRLTGTALEVHAEAPIPSSNVMIVANHSSYLDGVVLSAVIRGPLSFIAKAEFARQAIAGPFLLSIGAIFVRRMDARGGVEDTATALDAARSGERIVSFPEGTFTRRPGLLPFRMGTFVVAAQAGVPVVPVALRGTRSILRDTQWLPRRGRIDVHIGKPIRADGADFESAVRLRDAARAAILARVGEPDLARG